MPNLPTKASDSDLSEPNSPMKMNNSNLSESEKSPKKMSDSDLSESEKSPKKISDSDLSESDKSPAKMSDSDLSESDKSPTKMSDSDLSEPNSPRVKSELELLRERNVKARDSYLASLMNDPEFAEIMGSINAIKNAPPKKATVRKSHGNADPSFRSHVSIPLERRKSARLENKSPIFTKDDLIDESSFKRKRYNFDEIDDLEEIVYKPKKSRAVTRGMIQYTPLILADQVTESMINNIARKVSFKVYSDTGTSCHQCRQKTVDQKTCCRSNNCIGVRGQFCGVCLENRYGEDVAVALKDPTWHCPVCRGICNCSFCRAKMGKRPTGILSPQAQQAGHKSVKDFLDALKGEGDYPHQDKLWKKFKSSKYLLGFSNDLTTAHMGGGVTHKMCSGLTLEEMHSLCQKQQEKLNSLMELHDEPHDLLGFVKGSGAAQMSNNVQYNMNGSLSLEEMKKLICDQEEKLLSTKKTFVKH